MTRIIFITATDTDAGKSYVTAGLVSAWLKEGRSVRALKPVATGIEEDGINADVRLLMQVQGIEKPSSINCYTYPTPAAPATAAKNNAQQIDLDHLVDWCHQQASDVDLCLIEGIGGLMVPLTHQWLVHDWIQRMMPCEILLVIAAKLGCVNHTLLTLEAMPHSPNWMLMNDRYTPDQHRLKMHAETLQPHCSPLVTRLEHDETLDDIARRMINDA
ncbi:MAG: dethiobiotin synthase [Mariprofundaceae bacterium]